MIVNLKTYRLQMIMRLMFRICVFAMIIFFVYRILYLLNHGYEKKLLSESKQGKIVDFEKKMKATIRCAAGYRFGTKLKTAFNLCFNMYNFDLFHAWDRSKTNNFLQVLRTCKSVKDMMEWLNNEYSADICVLKKIDWLNDDLNVLNDTIHQDLRNILHSLPEMTLENDNSCYEDMVILVKESIIETCKHNYNPNELSTLNEIGENVVSYECFLQKFEQMCSEFIWD